MSWQAWRSGHINDLMFRHSDWLVNQFAAAIIKWEHRKFAEGAPLHLTSPHLTPSHTISHHLITPHNISHHLTLHLNFIIGQCLDQN